MFRDNLHLDRVAQVGLVGAVFQRRVGVGNLRPDGVDLAAIAELLKNALHDRLDRGKDVFLRHKAHLEVELIEIGRRPVGARILVPETGRDLEILVKTRNHQQLLELLGGLRQGVELARMLA